jgi:hypothetical protein
MRRKLTSSIAFLPVALLCAACGGSGETPPPVPVPAQEPPPLSLTPVPVPPQPGPARADPGFERVRAYTEQFYRGDLEKLYERFSPEMRATLPLERLRALRAQIAERYGKEVAVLGEDSQVKGEYRGFVRWARFDRYDGVMEVQWILRKDDSVAGLFVRPARTGKAS